MRRGVDAARQAGDHDKAGARQFGAEVLGDARPLAEALRPPTMRDGTEGQKGDVALHGDHRRRVVEHGPAAADSPASPRNSSRAPSFAARSSSRIRVRLGRHHRRAGSAAGAGEPRQRAERRGGGAVAGEQAAVGQRADAFGAGQAQAVDVVLLAHTGWFARARAGSCCPPAEGVPLGASATPCPLAGRCAARCRRAGGGCWRGGGINQHGNRQRKLNDAGIGQPPGEKNSRRCLPGTGNGSGRLAAVDEVVTGSADREHVLEAWGLDPGRPPEGQRHVADVLKEVLAALSAAAVQDVLVGTMVYGLHASAYQAIAVLSHPPFHNSMRHRQVICSALPCRLCSAPELSCAHSLTNQQPECVSIRSWYRLVGLECWPSCCWGSARSP